MLKQYECVANDTYLDAVLQLLIFMEYLVGTI